MSPEFPQFKDVTLEDRPLVESYTRRFAPYSDFNFVSLWSWDTNQQRKISTLNDNLVVQFTDYSTHKRFLSFLGAKEAGATAKLLLEYSRANGIGEQLLLVPADSASDIDASIFSVQEDRANFDYICSIGALSKLDGGAHKSKRKSSVRFQETHPAVRIETADLANRTAQEQIMKVLRRWEKHKVKQGKDYELAHEEQAIGRLCETAQSHQLTVFGVFLESEMIAFSIAEILPNQYAMAHFWKGDNSYRGVYDFLMQKEAQHLETMDVEFINYEQDLGVENLRAAKMAMRPHHFLKKFTVTLARDSK